MCLAGRLCLEGPCQFHASRRIAGPITQAAAIARLPMLSTPAGAEQLHQGDKVFLMQIAVAGHNCANCLVACISTGALLRPTSTYPFL